jgi:hypothetical protein
MAKQWVEQMSAGNLHQSEVWIALQPTIWPTLMSKYQWGKNMSILLNYVLPGIGIPREIVFTPAEYFWLTVKHLYTLQEITRHKNIIVHTDRMAIASQLELSTLEVLQIEVGSMSQLHHIYYDTFLGLATDSLVKNTWQLLMHENDLYLETIPSKLPWERNLLLMEYIGNWASSFHQLLLLNKCPVPIRYY